MICMPKKLRWPAVAKRAVEQTFAKPATSRYPFVKPQLADNFRGQPIFDFSSCIGCGLCSRDCPAKAIEMVTIDGKKRPQLNLSSCVFCFQCAESCPKKPSKTHVIMSWRRPINQHWLRPQKQILKLNFTQPIYKGVINSEDQKFQTQTSLK